MQLVVRPFLADDPDKARIVQVDKNRPDEVALVLDCDDVRAEGVVQLIRLVYSRNEWRCYCSQTENGGWVRV